MNHDHDPFLEDEGAAFWGRWLPVFETGTAAVSDALLDAAAVAAGTRILDLACGPGATTCAAARRGAQATGLDLNPHMLEQAPDCGATFLEGDMLKPPAGPWDAIVSRFGAHHAPAEWLPTAVRTLAPGGRLAIAEWAPDTALFDLETDEDLPTELSAADWVSRFEEAGLEDLRSEQVAVRLDFGDEATFQAFLDDMEHAVSRSGAPGGVQDNQVYIVSGARA